MSAAHTPGPWYTSSIRTHGADPSLNGCDIGSENGSNVALVIHQPEDREVSETVANAQLIAAAPETLARLANVRAALVAEIDDGDECRAHDAMLSRLIRICDGETL